MMKLITNLKNLSTKKKLAIGVVSVVLLIWVVNQSSVWFGWGGDLPTTSSTTSTLGPLEGLSVNELRFLDETLQPNFDDLMRNFEDYVSALVFFKGEVSQVLSRDDDDYQVLVKVTEGEYGLWTDAVLLRYSLNRGADLTGADLTGARLLDDDMVEFVGVVSNLWETKNIMGQTRWIPSINVVALNLEGK
jgi:hypothetical protein